MTTKNHSISGDGGFISPITSTLGGYPMTTKPEAVEGEVELPPFDWKRMAEVAADDLCTPEEHPEHEACMACLAIRGTRWALSMRDAWEAALRDKKAAEQERDALHEKVANAEAFEILAQAELSSLRASVGGEKWIDVKQRMPKRNEPVDLWIVGDSHTVAFYDTAAGRHAKKGRTTSWLWDGQRWCATGGLSLFLSPGVEATHWQPLPAPPSLPNEKES